MSPSTLRLEHPHSAPLTLLRYAEPGAVVSHLTASAQLLVLAVTDLGHVWQWSLPLGALADRAPQPPQGPTGVPTGGPPRPLAGAPPKPPVAPSAAASPAASAKAATRPQLLGLLHMLPHPVGA